MMKKRFKDFRPAVFLDRDGTIIHKLDYPNHPSLVSLYESTSSALKILKEAGFVLVLVTNQSGVSRGYLSREVLEAIHKRMVQLLHRAGVDLDGIYYCPHHPNARCRCRKPAPGMVERAARELKLDVRRSYVIGDKTSDIELAQRVGAQGILVLTGLGRAERRKIKPDKVCKNILSAARWIVSQTRTVGA